MKLKYIKSKYFNCHFYQCLKCGLDIKPYLLEAVSNPSCKCGTKFTAQEVIEAKDNYITELETTN